MLKLRDEILFDVQVVDDFGSDRLFKKAVIGQGVHNAKK